MKYLMLTHTYLLNQDHVYWGIFKTKEKAIDYVEKYRKTYKRIIEIPDDIENINDFVMMRLFPKTKHKNCGWIKYE